MGRVRRYKKIKAIDPFAKKTKSEPNTFFDDPPDSFYERKAMKEKKLQLRIEDPEILIQRQAIRAMRDSSVSKVQVKKIDSKQDDESMKKFKRRIRQETRLALRDEIQKSSKTSQKRKERLKERKQKRKGSQSSETYDEDVIQFHAEDLKLNRADSKPTHLFSENSYHATDNSDSVPTDGPPRRLRASDLGGPEAFSGAENIAFGEVSYRPPNIKQFNLKKRRLESIHEDNSSTSGIGSRKKSASGLAEAFPVGLKSGIIHAGSSVSPSLMEMEGLRDRVQEAYRKVKEKRRSEGRIKM